MKKISLIFLSMLFAVCCMAQTFSFGIKTIYSSNFETFSEDKFEFSTFLPINEDQAIESKYERAHSTQKKYNSRIGDGGFLKISFALGQHFSIRTGLGFQFSKFNTLTRFTDFEDRVLVSTDTIAYSVPTFSGLCDVYTNDYSEFGEPKLGEDYSIFFLNIPLEIEYILLNDKLLIRPGVFLQTPLFSKREQEFISISNEMVGDELHCTYIREKVQDKSGSNLRNFQWGASFHVAYRVMKWLELEAGVAQNFSNVFYRNEEWSNFYGNDENYRPLNISLGLNFLLVKKEKDL